MHQLLILLQFNRNVQAAVAPNVSTHFSSRIPSLPHCSSKAKMQPILQQAMFLNSVPEKKKKANRLETSYKIIKQFYARTRAVVLSYRIHSN
jgi:hypothetical protein